MTPDLQQLARFINGPPVRHLPVGKDFSLVSLDSGDASWLDGFVHGTGLRDRIPTRIISAVCSADQAFSATRLAWTTAMHLLLAEPDALPCTSILRAVQLVSGAGFQGIQSNFACGAAWLDCTERILRLAYTPDCSIACIRGGEAVPLNAMNAQHCSKETDTLILSGWCLLEPGDRIVWTTPAQPETTNRRPALVQTLEGTEFEFSKTLRAQDETEIGDAISTLADTLSATLEAAGFDSADTRVRLIIEEGILNAWKHGNRKDPGKGIQVRWRTGIDCILEIEDEGPGFDFHRLDDPRNADNLLKLCGRGIFIIRNYAGGIDWEKGGRLVRITIQRGTAGQECPTHALHCHPNLVECWKGMK